MNTASDHEQACRRVAQLFPERWLRMYVAPKLRNDPIFPAAFEVFRDCDGPILDIGCGVGLLGAYLRERGITQRLVGIDCDGRKIRRARQIAERAKYAGLRFLNGDARELPAAFRGNVALLDVLHYLKRDEQTALLRAIQSRLGLGGVLIIRDAPRDRTARFWVTYASELFAQALTWNVSARLNFLSRDVVKSAFATREFECEMRPLWGRTPFNNHLFVFRRRASEAVPLAV